MDLYDGILGRIRNTMEKHSPHSKVICVEDAKVCII